MLICKFRILFIFFLKDFSSIFWHILYDIYKLTLDAANVYVLHYIYYHICFILSLQIIFYNKGKHYFKILSLKFHLTPKLFKSFLYTK